ncbi:MAG: hypothetical protein ACYDCN_13005 [Bacteroidia bacterium]
MANNSVEDKLELHYSFIDEDRSHSMDAVIRNRCEHELLQIVSTVSKELNIHIKTETEVYDEGGLKEFYTFLGTAEGQKFLISDLITILIGFIMTRIPLRKSKSDKQLQELTIEEKKLNIEILKQVLESKTIKTKNINIEKIENIITNNIKILKHISNFYKALYNYPKVNRLSTVRIYKDKKQTEEPRIVERKDFGKFILESDNLDPITDDNATIEIISPVLKKGGFKWRGIYNKMPTPIEFSMKDKEFRDNVIKEEGISFKSGSFIDCIIEVSRKIDDLGNIYNSNYAVLTVLRKHEEGISTETPQGKQYKKKKEADRNQINLFGNENEIK